MVEVAAPRVEKASERGGVRRPGAGHRRAEHARAVVDVEGLVTVFVLEFLHLVRDLGDRLIPGDLLPLAISALCSRYAFHRLLKPVWVVDAVADRTATNAGQHALVAERVVTGVVSQHTYDRPVLHLQTHRASRTTVNRAGRPHGRGIRNSISLGCRCRRSAWHAEVCSGGYERCGSARHA